MYSSKFSRLARSYSFPVSYYHLSLSSIGCSFHVFDIKIMSWYLVLHSLEHLVNYIISIFQFTSRLCLTNQLYPKNMSMSFKFVTTVSICSMCLLISSSNSANCVTYLFLVLSALKILNDLFIGSILIFSIFTSCLSIPV